ncbi:uncharacterized protein LOC142944905 isoform X4 [Anarhichas minor]
MMKKTGRVMICCVALLLVLTSVSAVQTKIDSINDLKKIDFGQSVPKHSLLLLYWFANAVNIDEDGDISLTFDPESRAYGSHHYGNFEELLDPLPSSNVRYQYYTVGSLNQELSKPLPTYVVRPPATEYEGSNRDRIIIRIRGPNIGWQVPQRIDQVYITQHIEDEREYDPDHTYRITTNLLRQIRLFSVGQNQQQLLQLRNHFRSNADVSHLRNTWGANLAGLGLLLFIVIQERYSFNQQNRPATNFSLQSNYGTGNVFTPQTYYRPATNFTPQNYNTHANMQNNGWDDALVKCIMFAFVLICLLIYMFSYNRGFR